MISRSSFKFKLESDTTVTVFWSLDTKLPTELVSNFGFKFRCPTVHGLENPQAVTIAPTRSCFPAYDYSQITAPPSHGPNGRMFKFIVYQKLAVFKLPRAFKFDSL